MKKMNKKGFTLAELLIVVAIIAVLVAIAIPVFNAQLEKSKESTDMANIRSAYAEVVAQYLMDNSTHSATAKAAGQKDTTWEYATGELETMVDGTASTITITAKTSGSYTVSIDADGKVTVT
jgi:prepilin-type N-terminal cleavage/methylation domain